MSNSLSRGKPVIKKVPGFDVWCSYGLGGPAFIISGVGDSPVAAFESMRDGIHQFHQEQAIDGYLQTGPC